MTNKELDEAVFLAVQGGAKRFSVIVARVGYYTHDDRAVDRSLQRLRRFGRIEYFNGWRSFEPKPEKS